MRNAPENPHFYQTTLSMNQKNPPLLNRIASSVYQIADTNLLKEKLSEFVSSYIEKRHRPRWEYKLVNLDPSAYEETPHKFARALDPKYTNHNQPLASSLENELVIAYPFIGVGLLCPYMDAKQLLFGNDHLCIFQNQKIAIFHSHEDDWWVCSS